MSINICKNCRNENTLVEIKDYEYEFEDNLIELIDVLKCSICGCIHWEDLLESHYQYECIDRSGITTGAVSGWATKHN